MDIKNEIISCPACGKKGTWTPENSNRPFCSSRCKLIDLGNWASEQYRTPETPIIMPPDKIAPDDNKL